MKTKRVTFLLIVLLSVFVPVANVSAQVLHIERSVIGGGGGHAENGVYTLDGTIGQPLVGRASTAPYELCSGFWCGASAGIWIYLPLILR